MTLRAVFMLLQSIRFGINPAMSQTIKQLIIFYLYDNINGFYGHSTFAIN